MLARNLLDYYVTSRETSLQGQRADYSFPGIDHEKQNQFLAISILLGRVWRASGNLILSVDGNEGHVEWKPDFFV